MRKLLRRFRYWVSDSQAAKDLAEELEFHRSLKQKELEQSGVPAADASSMSRRSMGNALRAMEDVRRVWISIWFEQAGQDLRYAARSLFRTPSFTLAAALTIALGVGANTGVFSMVDAVLLRPLPVENPKELVFLQPVATTPPFRTPLYPCLAKLPAETGSLEGLAVYAADELRIEIDGRPEQVMGQVASGNYFQLLGVKPALGRLMDVEDEKLGPPIVVLSDRYWRQRFGTDPSVIGKTISFGRQVFTIAGVTPPVFRGLEPGRSIDITLPITISGNLHTSGVWWFNAIARLESDKTIDGAKTASNVAFQSCMAGEPPTGPDGELDHRLEFRPAAHGTDSLRRRFSDPLYALTGVAALVLMLATLNIANLLLARGITRRREFAIRLATGAGRARLVRQLLSETFLLFGLGAIPGVLFARWGVTLIEALFAQGRRPITLEANFNWRVLLFSITITLTAGLLSVLFPVWRAFRTDPERAIREGQTRTSESISSATLARALVSMQVALSLVLLVAAVTFVQTLANLHHVDPGFQNKQVLTMSIVLPEGYVQAGKSVESWDRVLQAVRRTPGVRTVAVSSFTPLSGRDPGETAARVRGHHAGEEYGSLRVNQVSEGYFETLGIPLLRGRLLSVTDARKAPKVALINESAARKFFGQRDPIGESLEFGKAGAIDSVYRIVGVTKDVKHRNLREAPPPFAFIPTRQPRNDEHRITLVVAAGTTGAPETLLQPIRNRIASVDPGLMVSDVITMQQQLETTLLAERLLSGLSGAFGVLALILAAVGLYGVLSYRVGQQRRAIGIRLALGASPSGVAFAVLGQSGLVVAAGLLCGLPFAALAARAADSMLWGVNSGDPSIYLASASLLGLVGLLSAYLPARQAAAIEPKETLRLD
jgi:predicted permease